MLFVIPLLALGVSAVTFRGRPPTWIKALPALCLVALLTGVVCGLVYGLVHWHGSELLLPAVLAALLAVSLVHVRRLLAYGERV